LALQQNDLLLTQLLLFLAQLLLFLAQEVYVCITLSSSKSLHGFQYLCLDIVYLLLDCLQLTGTRHPDAEVELSLSAPEDEGSGREIQDIATQRSSDKATLHEVNKQGVKPDIPGSLSQLHQRHTNGHYVKRCTSRTSADFRTLYLAIPRQVSLTRPLGNANNAARH